MNKKQLIAMWIGIGIMVFIALFPPTMISNERTVLPDETLNEHRGYGYKIVLRPSFLFSNKVKQIQYDKMALCQFVTALITSGLIVTLNKKKVSEL